MPTHAFMRIMEILIYTFRAQFYSRVTYIIVFYWANIHNDSHHDIIEWDNIIEILQDIEVVTYSAESLARRYENSCPEF